MPRRVVIALIAFGAGALLMLATGLGAIWNHDENYVTDLAAILGIAELITLSRLIDRNQIARVVALSLCLVQTLLGVVALIRGLEIALPMIALAAFVVVPLSTGDADEYFDGAVT